MGATIAHLKVSLADDKHLFSYISSQDELDRKATIERLWEEEDTNKSNYLEKKEADHFFERVYAFLVQKGMKFESSKEELIKAWIELFDTNKDGKISIDEFKQNINLLVTNPNISEFTQLVADYSCSKVLELSKLSLINLPSMDMLGLGKTDATVEITTLVNGAPDYRKIPVIENDNNPVFHPGFIYFPVNCLKSDFTFNIWDDDVVRKEAVGNFKLNVLKELNEKLNQLSDEEKDRVVPLVLEGTINLSPEASVLAKSESKEPKYRVEFKYEELVKTQGVKEPSKTDMNKFNKIFWFAIQKTRSPPVNAKDIRPPKTKKSPHHIPFTKNIKIFGEESTTQNFAALPRAFCQLITSMPEEENEFICWDQKDAIEVLARENMLSWIPKATEGEWTDTTSDESLTRFFFQGIGATRVAKCEEGFVVDFDSLKIYHVRKGYASPQGKLFFNPEGVVNRIEYKGATYHPSKDSKWEHLKFLFRSTALIVVTAVEHLTLGHLLWSNLVTDATHTRLGPSHPIRRLLHIHTYRASYVNQVAYATLLPEGGALQHVVCWPYNQAFKIIDDAYVQFRYETFSNFLEKRGMKDVDPKLYPLAQDGIDYWNVVHRYVTGYFKLFFPTEEKLHKDQEIVEFWTYLSESFPGGLPPLTLQNITEVLTQFIFYVSAMHTQVGTVGAYCLDPRFAAGCVGEDQVIALPQNFYAQVAITVGTAGEMPMMMQDWSHLYENKDAKEVWANFNKELKQLSETIDERNKTRKWIYNNFNPVFTETSIAV